MNINYNYPATLIKSGKESNGRIPIEIVPSQPSIDRVNDKIVLKAFEDARDSFLDEGIIDYDHQSVLGKSKLEKAQAIIGEPEDLYINLNKKIPICKAALFKGNVYVDTVIMPALENDGKVFGASVGGKVLRKSFETDPETKKEINKISKILLKHIAITPRQNAVHPETSVKLLKSFGEDFELILDNFDGFLKSFSDKDFLAKTLMAGSATNISNMSGGQVIQKQSLEGVNYGKIKSALPFILDGLGNIFEKNKSFDDWEKYLIFRGFSKKEAMEIIRLLAENKAKIVELI